MTLSRALSLATALLVLPVGTAHACPSCATAIEARSAIADDPASLTYLFYAALPFLAVAVIVAATAAVVRRVS